jgi:hypothetical protein
MLKQSLLAITIATVPLIAHADVGTAKGSCGRNQVTNNQYLERIIENLEGRVNDGVKDGSLVSEEPSRLSSHISDIRTTYGHLNQNGKWAVAEGRCVMVEEKLKNISNNIYKQRHDNEGNVAGSKKAKAQSVESK